MIQTAVNDFKIRLGKTQCILRASPSGRWFATFVDDTAGNLGPSGGTWLPVPKFAGRLGHDLVGCVLFQPSFSRCLGKLD